MLIPVTDQSTLSDDGPAAPSRISPAEIIVAVAFFIALCVVSLTTAASLLEPDDYAYRASIVALTHGQIALSDTEYQSLITQLTDPAHPATGPGPDGGQAIQQWVQLPDGRWLSEKNPGYPFLAAPFQYVGALRWAPLFYGALACLAMFVGARRWLGAWAGTWAVGLFCGSGAALVFAWRATMPTFTDAALIAAGAGALLWTGLARERTTPLRISAGLLGFLAIEAAVAVRYTNVVFLIVAVVVSLIIVPRCGLSRWALAWWLGSVALLVAALALFNHAFYGSAFATGYSSGVITFSLASIAPNLTHLPLLLVQAMPLLVLASVAVVWCAVRVIQAVRNVVEPDVRARWLRDGWICAALAAGWLGLWALYAAYDWTARMAVNDGGGSVHLIRFYLPSLGPIALLATWFVMQIPRWIAPVVVVGLFVAGVLSFQTLSVDGPGRPGGPGGPPPGLPGGPGGPGGPPPGLPGGPGGPLPNGLAPSPA